MTIDLTAAIEHPGAPPEQVAMVCANLGAVHRAEGRTVQARQWLERALGMAEHMPDKGEMVRRLLEEMQQGERGGAGDEGNG